MSGGSITALIGGNGDGKTLGMMALHAAPAFAKGRHVASSFKITLPNSEPHPLWICITDPDQIDELEHCCWLIDEVNASFPSRSSMSLPAELLRKIHQLRKPDVDVCWTAVNWSRADSALREATKRVTTTRGWRPDRWERERGVPPWWRPYMPRLRLDGGKPMPREAEWDSMSGFTYKTYDARSFDEFSVHAIANLKPISTQRYWRPWHEEQFMYDTLEEVMLWSTVDDHGYCLKCHGVKSRPKCTCPRPPRVARDAAPIEGQAS
ncbi:MAG: phiB5 08 [Acidimicrobiaceae bacterium]|nr:phiB5 08 [Acidimicrobiaceae bacterium]